MVSIYFSLTGSVSLLSAFIVSLLPTRWSHSWLLCTIFSFLSFLLWFLWYLPPGGGLNICHLLCRWRCRPFTHKNCAFERGIPPNAVKYHTRGLYTIQDDGNKIKQFWRTYILAKVYKCALPLKLQRSVYSNGSSSSSSFFCSDLLVPYESGLDSIEGTKTISLPLHQSFFFTPSYNETLRG